MNITSGQYQTQIDCTLCSQRWRISMSQQKQDPTMTVTQIMSFLLQNSVLFEESRENHQTMQVYVGRHHQFMLTRGGLSGFSQTEKVKSNQSYNCFIFLGNEHMPRGLLHEGTFYRNLKNTSNVKHSCFKISSPRSTLIFTLY